MRATEQIVRKLDLLLLLDSIEDYVLIKMSAEFPDYTAGSDIDLLVYDVDYTVNTIKNYWQQNLANHRNLQVNNRSGHCHLDFLSAGDLDFRIDLINNFDFFRNIAIKPSYLTKVFINRTTKRFDNFEINVPDPVDELTLRYFEYLEWFDRYPDKIRHIDYIVDTEDEVLKQKFFQNTHRFIEFKPKKWPPRDYHIDLNLPELYSGRQAVRLIRYALSFLKMRAIERVERNIRKNSRKNR